MKPFNIAKYEGKIAGAQRLYDATKRFQEVERIPISISVGGSFYARLFGYNIKDYYAHRDVCLEVQLRGLKWAFEELGDDRAGGEVSVDLGPIYEGLYFGLPIQYPDDTSPWIVPQLKTPEDIERLQTPDPEDHEPVLRVYRLYEELKERVEKLGAKVPVSGGFGIHPPLSCACAIMTPDLVYYYMATEPDLMRQFFAKLLAAWLKLQEFHDRYFGQRTTTVGLADDNSAFISNAMYRQMVLPYNLTIYERYGRDGRFLHADGPNDHHFEMYAKVHRLTKMDIGGWSDIANAKRAMHGYTVISGGLNCRGLYYDFARAKPAVDRALRIGGPGGGYIFAVGGETYVGVNPDTLIRVVQYVRKAGQYPLDLEAMEADAETFEILAQAGVLAKGSPYRKAWA